MAASAAPAAESAEPSHSAARRDGALGTALLPVSALRLAVRYSVPLAMWFSAGTIIRYAAMILSAGERPGCETT
ncbi:hypothetical protein [Actinoallomurus sp. NPDC052274]|uniref:hypothetical protein n=1 Tax=Actinoallomurus sp. NPDC052274 TaxID=3155420 RepID=UPI00343268F8